MTSGPGKKRPPVWETEQTGGCYPVLSRSHSWGRLDPGQGAMSRALGPRRSRTLPQHNLRAEGKSWP